MLFVILDTAKNAGAPRFAKLTWVFFFVDRKIPGPKIGTWGTQLCTKSGEASRHLFVVSTGVQRSGEICGFPHLSETKAE